LPRRGGGKLGEICDGISMPCERSLTCVRFSTQKAYCLPLCSPELEQADDDCPTDFGCYSIKDNFGICLNETSLRTGESCGLFKGDCPYKHICALTSDGQDAFCRQSCSSTEPCPSDYVCKSAIMAHTSQSYSVCVPK
jgi:hypothetical protein